MKHAGLFRAAACTALFFAAMSPRPALADDFNDRTIITFSNTVQVPGATLPAGTYVFKVLETSADRVTVQISNKREDKVFALVNATPNHYGTPESHRDDPQAPTTGKTVITFYETSNGQPQPIKTWFYPGQSFGLNFTYSKAESSNFK
jgi:hypothetical protein